MMLLNALTTIESLRWAWCNSLVVVDSSSSSAMWPSRSG